MTPTRNIYVKKGDEGVWDQAIRKAGSSLSSLITRLLADYLQEAKQGEEKLKEVIARLERKGIKEPTTRGIAQRIDPHYGIQALSLDEAETAIEAVARGKASPIPAAASVAAGYDPEFLQLMFGALQSLPEGQRNILTAVYFDKRSNAEIAKSLGVSVSTVKRRINAGLRAMREKAMERLKASK